ncbi:hypothetical protein CDL15_Pgr012751 [Punica granatum]|uniref:Uncharacterized protein n=1 Tax=Punica granatum TaxID=22663 RepID=A0A218XEV1_PUNGR|nr:hypothetical protein CDL15_Pgr012751 [Punica granatum]PKH94090.1 hypothetical protein CRG98_049768 [Punica granatum]
MIELEEKRESGLRDGARPEANSERDPKVACELGARKSRGRGGPEGVERWEEATGSAGNCGCPGTRGFVSEKERPSSEGTNV